MVASRLRNHWSRLQTTRTRWKLFQEDVKQFNQSRLSQGKSGALSSFSDIVRVVEIEPHSFCNRTCSFCGNSVLDRKSVFIPMKDAIFLGILETLQAAGYKNEIRFARYSEPLASDHIHWMIQQARKYCPQGTIKIISNGDYLSREKLFLLHKSGLDRLHVSVYLPNRQPWTLHTAQANVRRFLERIDCQTRKISHGRSKVEGVVDFPGLAITFNCVNYDEVGLDRGEEIEILIDRSYVRTEPCMQVFHNVTIDYDGTIMPCCNLRGDDPGHKQYVLGKLSDSVSLMDIWADATFDTWRDGLQSFGEKSGPCKSCKQLTLSQLERAMVKPTWKL